MIDENQENVEEEKKMNSEELKQVTFFSYMNFSSFPKFIIFKSYFNTPNLFVLNDRI